MKYSSVYQSARMSFIRSSSRKGLQCKTTLDFLYTVLGFLTLLEGCGGSIRPTPHTWKAATMIKALHHIPRLCAPTEVAVASLRTKRVDIIFFSSVHLLPFLPRTTINLPPRLPNFHPRLFQLYATSQAWIACKTAKPRGLSFPFYPDDTQAP